MSTAIEWASNPDGTPGESWNPIAGCNRVSPGCQHCYAERMARRLQAMKRPGYEGVIDANGRWTGKINTLPDKLLQPFDWRKPRTIFLSMSDPFHADVPDAFLDAIFAVCALTPHHRYVFLTKRADRMRAYSNAMAALRPEVRRERLFPAMPSPMLRQQGRTVTIVPFEEQGYIWPLPNVVKGVSAEDQSTAKERVPDLLQTPAAVRCISAEPLLGPLDISGWLDPIVTLDWVIVGGESGPGARPMHIPWVESIRDECAAAGVPFFFKQHGAHAYSHYVNGKFEPPLPTLNIKRIMRFVDGAWYRPGDDTPVDKFLRDGDWYCVPAPKHRTGRRLDRVEYSQRPAFFNPDWSPYP